MTSKLIKTEFYVDIELKNLAQIVKTHERRGYIVRVDGTNEECLISLYRNYKKIYTTKDGWSK